MFYVIGKLVNVFWPKQRSPKLLANYPSEDYLVQEVRQIVKRDKVREYKYVREQAPRESHVIGGQDTASQFKINFCRHYNINSSFQNYDLYARMLFPDISSQPALVPIESYNNDFECIRGRIKEPRIAQQNVPPLTGQNRLLIRKSMREFEKYLRENIEPLTPLTSEEVINTMPKRNRAEAMRPHMSEFEDTPGIRLISCFQKKETYGTVKAPRNISAVDDAHLLRASRYSFAVSNAIHESKQLRWWCPGRDPVWIGNRIADLTRFGRYKLFGADYKCFDGYQRPEMRRWAARLISTLFLDPRDREDCRQTIEDEIDASGKTRFGIIYELDGSMASGSAWTTIGNTILNAFVYFTACIDVSRPPAVSRETFALFNQCMVYGDDSIGPVHIEERFIKICEMIGLSVETEDFTDGVFFLGRIYFVDGFADSMMDPARVMPKLNITCAPLAVPTEIAVANRFNGYLSATLHEPWIAEICRAVLRVYGNPSENFQHMTNDELRMRERKGYHISQEHIEQAWVVASKRLNMDFPTLHDAIEQYKSARTIYEFPSVWHWNGRIANSKVREPDGTYSRVWCNDPDSWGFECMEIANVDDDSFINSIGSV